MKKGILIGLAALAVGVVVFGKKIKKPTLYKKPYGV